MDAATFAQSIHGARKSGPGWLGRCPAHDDQRSSLSWKDGEKGVVVKCHAGCETEAVVTAAGLAVRELFRDETAPAPTAPLTRTIVATYAYRDEAGTVLYEAVRYAPKDFRQRRPNGQGGWLWNLDGVRRVVYCLPELATQKSVYVVEGEKDVDRLWALGLAATCNVGGAGKWRDDLTAQLVAAGVERVIILPDNDPPGTAHAEAVQRSCVAAGLEAVVLALPGVPPKGDVSDWLAAGHTKDDLLALAQPGKSQNVYDPALDWEEIVASWTRTRYRTGLDSFDRLTGGMMAGQLIVVAGRTSHGKTSACLAFTASLVRAGVAVDYLTLEEPRWVVTRRLIAAEGKIAMRRLADGTLDEQEFREAEAAVRRMQDWPLVVSDLAHVRAIEEESVLEAVRNAAGQVIVVDHVQQIATRDQSRVYGLERVVRSLQAEAIAKRKVVILAAQLSRTMDDEQRAPRISDIRDSGAIEQAARQAWLLYWPVKHDASRGPEEYEIHVAKNSEGPTGVVHLRFEAWNGRFEDLGVAA